MNSGVYKILNTVTGKMYIGSAVDLYHRKRRHFWELKKNRHPNSHLQRSFNKYGIESFSFMVILYCSKRDVTFLEQCCMDSTPKEQMYNICPVAGSILGVKRSQETKNKMSLSGKKYKASDETKLKISNSLKRITEEQRLDIIRRSNETRYKNKPKIVKSKEPRPAVSDVTRKKISIAHLGMKHSDESKLKMQKWHLGKSLSSEHKTNIGKALKGLRLGKLEIMFSADQLLLMKKMYDEKKCLSHIAKHFNCSNTTIRNRLGITPSPRIKKDHEI